MVHPFSPPAKTVKINADPVIAKKKGLGELVYPRRKGKGGVEKEQEQGRMKDLGCLERRELRGGIVTVIERLQGRQDEEAMVMEGLLEIGREIGEVDLGRRTR